MFLNIFLCVLTGYHFEILLQTKGCLEGKSTYKWKTSFTWFQGLTEHLHSSFLGLLANTWPYCQAAAALFRLTWPHPAYTLCLAKLIALLCPASLSPFLWNAPPPSDPSFQSPTLNVMFSSLTSSPRTFSLIPLISFLPALSQCPIPLFVIKLTIFYKYLLCESPHFEHLEVSDSVIR